MKSTMTQRIAFTAVATAVATALMVPLIFLYAAADGPGFSWARAAAMWPLDWKLLCFGIGVTVTLPTWMSTGEGN